MSNVSGPFAEKRQSTGSRGSIVPQISAALPGWMAAMCSKVSEADHLMSTAAAGVAPSRVAATAATLNAVAILDKRQRIERRVRAAFIAGLRKSQRCLIDVSYRRKRHGVHLFSVQ
ncbi:MAG: hypothetical protein BWZ07_03203 [Alphaproteobacteria bacterium ADurb.BinA280]|nr:MAG: hypothetical protein BWZ07_03203 [Alphaproteobacteria bacterium ADurb.BinA280]